jgi:hypothetical protein
MAVIGSILFWIAFVALALSHPWLWWLLLALVGICLVSAVASEK